MQSAIASNNGASGLRSMESSHKSIVMLRCKVVIVGTRRSLKLNPLLTPPCPHISPGDACVGKTALTQVFQSGGSTYPKNYIMVRTLRRALFCAAMTLTSDRRLEQNLV